MTTLERRYGSLLATYPAAYRRQRRAEMVGTLMESARPGQRWPSVADAVDLLAGGVRHRLGLSSVPGLAAGLAIAGPIALALAAGIGGLYLTAELRAEPWEVPVGYRGFGPFPTIGVVVYAAWILAGLGRAALGRLTSRWLIGVALALTVLVVPLAAATGRTRPSLPLLAPLFLFGLVALLASREALTRRQRRVALVLPVAAAAAFMGLVYWQGYGVEYVFPGDPRGTALVPEPLVDAWTGALPLDAVALALVLLLAGLLLADAVHLASPARDRRLVWAATILFVPAAPLLFRLAGGLAGRQYGATALLPAGLAAGVVTLAVAVRAARRDLPASSGVDPERALSYGGAFAAGAGAAVAWLAVLAGPIDFVPSGVWPGYVAIGWSVAALAVAIAPPWFARGLVALAVGLSAWSAPVDVGLYVGVPVDAAEASLYALGIIAFAGVPPTARRSAGAHFAVVGLGAAVGAAISAGPAWWYFGTIATPGSVPLAAAAAIVVGFAVALRAYAAPGRRGVPGPAWVRARGVAMQVAVYAWVIAVARPTIVSSPLLLLQLAFPFLLLAMLVAAALLSRRHHRTNLAS
jgi:hypothetical protein